MNQNEFFNRSVGQVYYIGADARQLPETVPRRDRPTAFAP